MILSQTKEAIRAIFSKSSLDQYTRLRKIAQLQNISTGARAKLEWMIFYEREKQNALKTARHFGISAKTFWKWRNRFQAENLRTLEEHSRAPIRRRQKDIHPLQEERIIALRKQFLRYGKIKLSIRYASEYGEKISSWKIQKIIEKYQLYYHPAKNYRTQKKRRSSEKKKRITEFQKKKKTFFIFGMDSIIRHWDGQKRYILTAVDTVSRFAFARMYTSHSSRLAADFLHRLMHLTDGKIKNIQTDNGSEFHLEFEKACKNFNLPHYWSRVRTSKDNPHVERFNRTLQEEFIQLGNRILDPVEFNQKLTSWLVEYNFKRPHQSLGYMTPMYFIQKNDPLLPMCPSDTHN